MFSAIYNSIMGFFSSYSNVFSGFGTWVSDVLGSIFSY